LKAEYKNIAGVDFPAGGIPTPQLVSNSDSDQSKPSVDSIVVKINEQGDKVRSMKNSKASKVCKQFLAFPITKSLTIRIFLSIPFHSQF